MKHNYRRNFVQKPVPPRRRVWSTGRIDREINAIVGASIGNDFTDGHRGEAHAKKSAKKYVHSRMRVKQKNFIVSMLKEV